MSEATSKGRIAIVTGAGTGIGRAAARDASSGAKRSMQGDKHT